MRMDTSEFDNITLSSTPPKQKKHRCSFGKARKSYSPLQGSPSRHPNRRHSTGEKNEVENNGISNDASELESLRKQNKKLKKQRDKAISSLKTFHEQHKTLVRDFTLLRQKYDHLKSENFHIIWEYLPLHRTQFSQLAQVDKSVFETPDRIGEYRIGELLGDGHFADVKLCTHAPTSRKYAVKIYSKSKIRSVSSLERIHRELHVLREVNHSNIVQLVRIIHSPTTIYVLTELAGRDLFAFFDANPAGVKEQTIAREVVLGIATPVVFLHSRGICHRDLKPENVLLKNSSGDISRSDIQICDFGQCSLSTEEEARSLSDSCGSPGFFAPEMLLGGEKYNGLAVDVWSLGCIMLELTCGHVDFCKSWMTSYDYNVLQDERVFESKLQSAVAEIHKKRNADVMHDFLARLLVMNPSERMESGDLLRHEWLRDHDIPGTRHDESRSRIPCQGKDLHLNSFTSVDDHKIYTKASPPKEETSTSRSRPAFTKSMSARARKKFSMSEWNTDDDKEDINNDSSPSDENKDKSIQIQLPPIEPMTPSVKSATTALMEGEKLLTAVNLLDDFML